MFKWFTKKQKVQDTDNKTAKTVITVPTKSKPAQLNIILNTGDHLQYTKCKVTGQSAFEYWKKFYLWYFQKSSSSYTFFWKGGFTIINRKDILKVEGLNNDEL